MNYRLLLSGERDSFTSVEFDTTKNEIKTIADYSAPFNASWVELHSSEAEISHLVGLSEGEDSGLLYTFKLDHVARSCHMTSQRPTLGAPAHFIKLRDGSAIVLATYHGGSVALYPLLEPLENGILLKVEAHKDALPEFPYSASGHGPNQERQEKCHMHQILEDKRGLIYALDLGSDRVWLFRRPEDQGSALSLQGWLQCPSGSGPRHAVFSSDEQLIYVIGELSHNVIAFDISEADLSGAVKPIETFNASIIPPNVHPSHHAKMDSAEISLSPKSSTVLYVSNRWERHSAPRDPHLKNVPENLPSGDAIAVISLSQDGRSVGSIRHVRTGVDVIRGMQVSYDGKYVIVLGQEDGRIEIYKISGEYGEIWKLAARLEALGAGLKHAVWLR